MTRRCTHPLQTAAIRPSLLVAPARPLLAALCAGVAAGAIGAEEPARSPLVRIGEQGLEYETLENGDRIPDFSGCGYGGGGVPIPEVPVRATLDPVPDGDDTQRIQDALNRLAAMAPDPDGFRGALLLNAGTYRVSGTLRIGESGVVLRGAGSGADGTIIIATGTEKRALIHIDGGTRGTEIPDSRRAILDERVPVGATRLRLSSTEGLAVGDSIGVFRPATEEWLRILGTDRLNRGPEDPVKNWTTREYSIVFDRRIADFSGDSIVLDAPVVFAIEAAYGGGYVYRMSPDLRIRQVGVEKLRAVSEYRRGAERSDEDHAWDAVLIGHLTDGWVREVTAVHFAYSCVNIGSNGSRITVQDSACLDPVSQITGGRRYSFALAGQRCLVQRCYTRGGRHDYVMHARARGPNVFLDCVADATRSDSGPHHRWATGTLYDNIACGDLNVQWRGRSGTGHGWAGANTVFWNCRARRIICERPPTANNYSIGCSGTILGDGYIAARGRPVAPRSLYLRQMEERLGVRAVENIATPEQRAGIIDELLRARLSK